MAQRSSFSPDHRLDQLPALVSGDVRGVEIWKWLAIFVVASLLLETAMTYRMIGLQQNHQRQLWHGRLAHDVR